MSENVVLRPFETEGRPSNESLRQILSQPKPTFAALDKAITEAAESVELNDLFRIPAFKKLKDQLFLSPRLSRWQLGISEKNVTGYSLRNSAENATVTVQEDRVVLSCPDPQRPKYPFNYEVMAGLPAATLFKTIQDSQAIIQTRQPSISVENDSSDEFFDDTEGYVAGAELDAALEETHPEPLGEDDAELIEDVTAEQALDEDQRKEDGPEPIITVSQKFVESLAEAKPESFTTQVNRKNASTDGVICDWCGNLNRAAYKGACPQCPKLTKDFSDLLDKAEAEVGKGAKESVTVSQFKSLQGRILTIIDGVFADKTQREAVKQMINKEFRRSIEKAGK